ncbi:hypothetical protein KHA94_02105 [Bacillus sp. FJAT-49705]|uniref:Uncharacterized protein n=1 Tax=Cytobacillus citreus TaxID=2833586 RepID=A0ABS5NNM7_9BACI|nr:hypothetical protein [Cytobacillus citreus]MBS4189008.1 hypothetical protein [Cytobacillus citreus]
MCPPNYKDFYQKALVPIGTNDFKCLNDLDEVDKLKHSHWLIALEGEIRNLDKEYYTWKITIYPSDSNGNFSWNTLYYSSPIFDSFHLAYEHAKNLEKYSVNDKLFSAKIRESAS